MEKENDPIENMSFNIFNEVLSHLSDIIKGDNAIRIKEIIKQLVNILLEYLSPYLYTIIILLTIIFIMNCSQFYYNFMMYNSILKSQIQIQI